MCPLEFLYPGGGVSLGSTILNTVPILYIYKAIEYCQNLLTLFLSILFACSTELGISMPYLWEHLRTRELTAAMILSLLQG